MKLYWPLLIVNTISVAALTYSAIAGAPIWVCVLVSVLIGWNWVRYFELVRTEARYDREMRQALQRPDQGRPPSHE